MGLGWFDAVAPALAGAGAQIQKGRIDEEERRRAAALDALRMGLLQTQLAKAQQPEAPGEYRPTTYDEAVKFYGATHPEKPAKVDTPEWTDAGFPDQESYLQYLGKKSRVQYPERFTAPARKPTASDRVGENEEARGLGYLETYKQGKSMGTGQGVRQADAFHEAYRAIRAQHPEMTPGRVGAQAFEATKDTHPELFRSDRPGSGDLIDDIISTGGGEARPVPEDRARPTGAVTTPTEQTAPSPTAPRRVISQDQADYLKATGKWDPALFEVR